MGLGDTVCSTQGATDIRVKLKDIMAYYTTLTVFSENASGENGALQDALQQ